MTDIPKAELPPPTLLGELLAYADMGKIPVRLFEDIARALKAEKGLEPVAETKLPSLPNGIKTDSYEGRQLRAYGLKCLRHAHPPTQVEPATQTELIEETASEFPLELRERVRDAMRNAWIGGYNECVDHPPASEWNDAIEAAATQIPRNWLDSLLTGPDKIGDYKSDIEPLLAAVAERIRALKQEPR